MPRVFDGVDALRSAAGEVLGQSEWLPVTQERIDAFAAATGDDQWIHVDQARAADGPYGATIAHGYLTLSLLPRLVRDVYRVEGVAMGVNYGLNKVRFLSPVVVGSKVRASCKLLSVRDVAQGVLAAYEVTVEIEGSGRPACVAETLSLLVPPR
jgi:acyl dehydratase